jgi:hypothetical protein
MQDSVRYTSDDRDLEDPNDLVIWQGGNGDWYVAVVPKGHSTIGRAVRLCTSVAPRHFLIKIPATISKKEDLLFP